MKRFLAVALGLIVGFGFSVSFQRQAFGTLPSTLNDRFFNLFGDAGSGATYVRVEAVTDAGGTLPSTLNDRWFNAFADAGSGLTALKVVCTGCGGGSATSVTLTDKQIAFGDSSNLMTSSARFIYRDLTNNNNYAFVASQGNFDGLELGPANLVLWSSVPNLLFVGMADGTIDYTSGGHPIVTINTATLQDDRLGRIIWAGYTATGVDASEADVWKIESVADSNWSSAPASTLASLRFSVDPSSGGSSFSEVFRLAPDQRISAASSIQTGGINTLNVNTAQFGLVKGATSTTAPGASGAKIGVLCGTNSGTLKMVMYAGTSTTAVTVVDNVGSGVTGC